MTATPAWVAGQARRVQCEGCQSARQAAPHGGWRLHGSLDQRPIYRARYGLLVITAVKLLRDDVSGYMA